MNKNIYTLLGIVSCLVLALFSSCNDSESTQEKLRKQQRAIDAFMDRSGLVVISKFPADSVFKANEYYRTDDGLYINIVKKGNGNAAQLGREISLRFDYCFDVQTYVEGNEDDATYYPHEMLLPYVFRYGVSSTYTSDYYAYLCEGMVHPLQYITEGAVVNLIVPAKLSNSYDQSAIRAQYFKNLEYTNFDINP